MKRLVLIVFIVAGCRATDSDDILTSGMYGSFTATATGNGSTTIDATLYLGSPSELIFIELTGDDQLIAWHGTQSKVMVEHALLNVVSHQAAFTVDTDNELFEVEFSRKVDPGAPSSTVTLPPKLDLVPPPTTASRAANLVVSWTPTSIDPMSWRITGECIDAASGTITNDPGTQTIPANTIRKRMAQNGQIVQDSCAATLEVTRTRDGAVDRAYGKGGSFTASQVRTQTFTTTL